MDRLFSVPMGTRTCILCNRGLETRDHLFFVCSYSEYLWTLARLKLGLPPIPIQTIDDEAKNISTSFTGKTFGTALARIVFRTVIWAIWKERNCRLHQGAFLTKLELSSFISMQVKLQLYMCKWPPDTSQSFVENWV